MKFVVGCYLAYLGDTDSDKSPVSSQVPSEAHWKVNNKGQDFCSLHINKHMFLAFIGPQNPRNQLSQIMYSIGMDTNQITKLVLFCLNKMQCFVFV